MAIKTVTSGQGGPASAENLAVERLQREIPGATPGPVVGPEGSLSELQSIEGLALLQDRIAATGATPVVPQDYDLDSRLDPRLAQITAQSEAAREQAFTEDSPRSPLNVNQGRLSDKAPSPDVDTQIAQELFKQNYAVEGGATLQQQQQREAEAAQEQLLETQPYLNAINQAKSAYHLAQTDEERLAIAEQIADLEEQKAKVYESFELQKQTGQIAPLVEEGAFAIDKRAQGAMRYHSQLKQHKINKKKSSNSGRALADMRDLLIDPMLNSTTSIPTEAAEKLGVFNSTPMGFLEEVTGIKHAAFLGNNVALAVAQTFIGGKLNDPKLETDSQDLDLDSILGPSSSFLEDFFEEKGDWAPESLTDELLQELPDFQKISTVMGSVLKDNLSRQGVSVNVNPDIIGQVIVLSAIQSGIAKVYDYTNPETKLTSQKVGWKPDNISEVAALGTTVFPVKYKKASLSPRGNEQAKRALTRVKRGVDTPVSADAIQATINMEQIPRGVKSAELGVAQLMLGLSTEYHQSTEDTPEMVIAANLLGVQDKTSTPNRQGQTPGQQNLETSQRNIAHMLDRIGSIFFGRWKVGANESRKYATHEENTTYYKTNRAIESAGANAIPEFVPVPNPEVITDINSLKKYVSSLLTPTNKPNVTEVHGQVGKNLPNKFKDMNFRFIVGSLLGSSNAKTDPIVALKEYGDKSVEWAAMIAPMIHALVSPSNPNATIQELVQARKTNTDVPNPEALFEIAPQLLGLLDSVGANKDTWGYKLSALIDNYLYNAAREYNKQNPGSPISTHLPSIVQFDLSSAGTSTMFKDAANVDGLKSVRLIVDIAPDGTPQVHDTARQMYWGYTIKNINEVFTPAFSGETGSLIGEAVSLVFDDYFDSFPDDAAKEDFAAKWGKAPIMVTGYSKHEGTHQDAVWSFFSKFPDFKAKVVDAINEHLGRPITDKELVDIFAKVHERSLNNLFGEDELKGIRFLKALGTAYHMGREAWKVNLFGQDMLFGIDMKEQIGSVEVTGGAVPLTSGESINDQLGRSPPKRVMDFTSDGKKKIRYKLFTPAYNTAISNSVLAAIGQKRESVMLDGILNDVQNTVKGAYSSNFYDGLSADANSALFLWYLGNYKWPLKTLESNPRIELVKQGLTDIDKTRTKIKSLKEPVDIAYPNGDWAAIGWEFDNLYRAYAQRRKNKGREIYGEEDHTSDSQALQKVFMKMEKLGWKPPELTYELDTTGNFYRAKLPTQSINQLIVPPSVLLEMFDTVLLDKGLSKGSYLYEEFKKWGMKGITGRKHSTTLDLIKNSPIIEWFTTK